MPAPQTTPTPQPRAVPARRTAKVSLPAQIRDAGRRERGPAVRGRLGRPPGRGRGADEWARKPRLVDGLAVAADGGLGGEPLVGRDMLDEAEQLGREWWLRQRRGPDSLDPRRHLDRVVVG